MLDLKQSDKNIITIFDVSSGSRIRYFYRSITTKDRLEYNSASVNILTKSQSLDKIQDVFKMQIEWADKIITGFVDGDLGFDGKPVSSDENSKNYLPGWRQVIKDTHSDHLISIAQNLFGQPNYVVKNDENFFFEKSSTASKAGGRRSSKRNT